MSTPKDLLYAFEQRNLVKFKELLEVLKVNPNERVESNDDRTVFETILSTKKSAEYIKLCLNNDADFHMKNKNGHYPLHCVIQSQCLENFHQIKNLLDDPELNSKFTSKLNSNRYSPYVNVKKKNGKNSLHILAGLITNDNFDVIFEMMQILLSYGCNANYPNVEDKTAFYIVLENLWKLERGAEVLKYFFENADVDVYTYRSDEMLEMLAKVVSPFVLPEREDVTISSEAMNKLLINFDINTFETLFKRFKVTCACTEGFQESCVAFMEIAVKNSLINIVELLIEFGADINRIPTHSRLNVPPTFLACIEANPALLNLFLLQSNIKLSYEDALGKHQTLLHQFFKIIADRDFIPREFSNDQKKCFDLLTKHSKCDRNLINENDENNRPVIYHAVMARNNYATMRLLKMGAYIGPVVNKIRKSLLKEFLDSTITTSSQSYDDDDDDDENVTIDYTFLSPPKIQKMNSMQGKSIGNAHQAEADTSDMLFEYSKEVKAFEEIANVAELRHFLAHPTISSFIMLKWYKVSFLVYINFIMISVFILSFMSFAYQCQNLKEIEKIYSFWYYFFQITSLITISCFMVREFTQAMLSIKQYVCSLSNWIDICLISLAMIFLLIEQFISANISRILRTMVILLATAEYFNILGMVPIMSISIQTKMFRKVCTTFLKSLLFYSMLVVAFGVCFYNLQGDKFLKDKSKGTTDLETNYDLPSEAIRTGPDTNYTLPSEAIRTGPDTNYTLPSEAIRSDRYNNFHTVGSSIIKSFVMLTGELEASYVNLEGWTYALPFMLFLFLVTIVLYNLLNAMALCDTQDIKKDAKLIDLHQRVSTMLENEEAIFQRKSKFGNWLKKVISLFPEVIPDGSVFVNRTTGKVLVNNKNPIIGVIPNGYVVINHTNVNKNPIFVNEWLPNWLKFLKYEAAFSPETLIEIENLLKARRDEQRKADVRRNKEGRNEKLTNDVASMYEMILEIQKNIANSKME